MEKAQQLDAYLLIDEGRGASLYLVDGPHPRIVRLSGTVFLVSLDPITEADVDGYLAEYTEASYWRCIKYLREQARYARAHRGIDY